VVPAVHRELLVIATIIHLLASQAIAALMLTAGLMTDRAVFADVGKRWSVLLVALVVLWVAEPLVVLGIVRLLNVSRREEALLLLMAISPGLPLVLQSVVKGHGSRQLSLVILLATAFMAPLLVPAWVVIVDRALDLPLHVSALDVLRVVAMSAILPFAVGRVVNQLAPRTAHRIAKVTNILFVVGILILGAVVIAKSYGLIFEISWRTYVAIALATFAALAIGYIAGGPDRENRIAVAYAAAFGNPALALAIAAASFPANSNALPLVGVYVLVRLVALIPFNLWARHSPANHVAAGAT
jgi:predicted Na+-dependent transporter